MTVALQEQDCTPLIYTVQRFGVGKIFFNAFERSLMLTKDDQKYLLSSVCYSLQCPMILHSNMLICSSINISDYYQC